MRSDMIKKGFERTPHRALLKACGVTDQDMDKPFIGVANSFIDIIPGHVHLPEQEPQVGQALSSISLRRIWVICPRLN